MDYQDRNRTFGPIFHKEEFLLPLLKLQKEIEALEVKSVGPDGKEKMITLKDVCNNPLSRPDKKTGICNIQSIWSYWQDSEETLHKITECPPENLEPDPSKRKKCNYLDHFLMCARYVELISICMNIKLDR